MNGPAVVDTRVMKLTDLTLIIANRVAAGATDRDTAREQIRVAAEQFPADLADLVLDLSCELLSIKAALAASKRGSISAT